MFCATKNVEVIQEVRDRLKETDERNSFNYYLIGTMAAHIPNEAMQRIADIAYNSVIQDKINRAIGGW